MKRKLKPWM